MTATKEQDQTQAHANGVCPSCGYCPHCGQSRQQAAPWYPYAPTPYVPSVWPQAPLPWVITVPQITWSGTGTYTAPNISTFASS